MGKYNQNREIEMAEYAMNLTKQAKLLEPPMNEHEIVRCIKRHYDREIAREIRPSTVRSIKDLIKL